MKKLLALLLSLSFLLTGCQDNNKEKALRFDVDVFPRTLDAQMAQEKEAVLVLTNTMAGLTKIEEDGKVVPDLCEKWEASDGNKRFTFTLKKDLLWADGRPLTSKDFSFSLERLISPKTHSPYAYRYMNIKNAEKVNEGILSEEALGISTPDERTLTVELEKSDLNFPSLMAQVSSFPCNEEFFISCKGKYGLSPDDLLCCGAFYLNSVEGDLMLLRSNKNSLSPAKTEKLYFCTKRGEAVDVFLEGRSEACIVSFNEYDRIKDYPSKAIYNRTFSLIINPSSPTGSDEIYREALLASPSVRENTISGNDILIKAEGIIPPAALLEDKNYRAVAGSCTFPELNDIDSLRARLQEEISGEKNEKMPKTEIITNSDELNFLIASGLQSIYSKELSLYVNILPMGESELSKKMASGDFQAALGEIRPDSDKPSLYLKDFSEIILKDGRRVGDILDRSERENDKGRKIRLIKEAEEALINEYYILPLYHAPTYIVSSYNAEGIEYLPSKQAVYFGNATLTE